MTAARLVRHEFRYERRAFARDPQAVFFAIGLPLLYVVIFVSLFGEEKIDFVYMGQPGRLEASTPMLANFISIGVISATLGTLAVALIQERETGVLKRLRGTPLPTWAFLGGHVGTALALGFGVAALLAVLGRLAYGIPVPLAGLPALLLAVLVGSACFSCLGFAFTSLVRRPTAAMPAVTGVTLALFFLSGNFFLIEKWPVLMEVVAETFPVKHLNDALLTPLNPYQAGVRVEWLDLGVLVLWGAAGLLVALRSFRWVPHGD